jgi:uncharacterized membrane protein YedE/YeeE
MVMRNLVALLCGVLFAVGLGIAGMTRPSKVLGFLDLAGDWDPNLAFVMAGAIAVGLPLFRGAPARRRGGPASESQVPTRETIDVRLVGGAALFGIGWGASGYCPGPALVSLTTLAGPALIFGAAMFAGMRLHASCERR